MWLEPSVQRRVINVDIEEVTGVGGGAAPGGSIS